MAMTIQVQDDLADRLRSRASGHGRSPEEEAQTILEEALPKAVEGSGAELVRAIQSRFGKFGEIDLDIPSRD